MHELKRLYDQKKWRGDQRIILARAIERNEQLCDQIGHIINTSKSYLFRALEKGKNVLLNFTGIQGTPQVFLVHTVLMGCYQYQQWKMP